MSTFFPKTSKFFGKIMTSNFSRDSSHDVDHIQTSTNIYNGDDDVHS